MSNLQLTNLRSRYRQLHRLVAPIMFLPILLTLLTGSLYQMAELVGKNRQFGWLIQLHKGNFGILNLEAIYPLFNALGLLVLAITGTSLWFQTRRRARRSSED